MLNKLHKQKNIKNLQLNYLSLFYLFIKAINTLHYKIELLKLKNYYKITIVKSHNPQKRKYNH